MKLVLFLGFLFFVYRRLLTYLHIFQQEEYDGRRFVRWLVSSRSWDQRVTLAVLVCGLLEFVIHLGQDVSAGFIAAAMIGVATFETDPRKASKKRLVMTARATRIYWLAFALLFAVAAIYSLPDVPGLAWIIPVQAVPFALPAANFLLGPYEKGVQQRFWNEAHAKLGQLRPTVIAITGSYGKTSTKHILGHILGLQAPTLVTPGSVNTPMGVSRIIREQLGPHHRFFVCEMGAYGPGSIARLCRLVPPDISAITAIGMAHYERFKSLETVAAAKYEIAQAAVHNGGQVIVNTATLLFPTAKEFAREHGSALRLVGPEPDATFRLIHGEQTAEGLVAEVAWAGQTYTLRAPLFGEHHISNIAMAFALACTAGVAPQDAVLALSTVPQISHRLEVKEGIAHSKLIDDAYNSNPVGFASALKLLGMLGQAGGGRRILVTPGMVEMGLAHAEEHRSIGLLAGPLVDVLLTVVPERIPTLSAAYQEARPDGLVVPCANFPAASAWLEQNVTAQDVVLLENDLPDVYEQKLRL